MKIHTTYGDVDCGWADLAHVQDMCPELLKRVDPDNNLVATGKIHFVDWDGVAVTLTLETHYGR